MKVTFEHVTKTFPGRGKQRHTQVVAVDDFNYEIPDGLLIGLLGPSGCGKSTALNLLCGLLTPTAGRILFGDEDVTQIPPEKRGVGMVFQNYALYPHLTVEENILFPLQNLKGAARPTKEQMKEKAREAAELVQIETLMERRPSELSGGQQQRVAIARALVKLPRVLLLDEPLSNLDARLRLQTREEIRRIQTKTGITTIFVTHDQEEAMSISDLIVVMKDGRVQQIGKPQAVYDDPDNLFVAQFLGTPPINVFDGRIEGDRLFIGEEAVLSWGAGADGAGSGLRMDPVVNSSENTESGTAHGAAEEAVAPAGGSLAVHVGIRPEGFIVDPDGPFSCACDRVEVMGRDVHVVCTHPALTSARQIRAVIDADEQPDEGAKTVRFRLKPHKVLLFDAETGVRLKTGW